MKNLRSVFLLILLASASAAGQTIESNNFYIFNMKTLNPAYTAKDQQSQLTVMGQGNVYKKNFNGIDYSSNILSCENYSKKLNSGLGVQFSNDNRFINTSRLGLLYRYGIKLGNAGTLSVGVGAKLGMIRYSYYNDLGIDIGDRNFSKAIVDAGLSYQFKNFHVGVSIMNMNKPTYHFGSKNYAYTYYFQTLNITAGNKFQVARWFSVEPLIYYTRYANPYFKYYQMAFNLQLKFGNRWMLGGAFWLQNSNQLYYGTYRYKNFHLNAGVVFLKRLELVSLLYLKTKGINNSYDPSTFTVFNYEFVLRLKL